MDVGDELTARISSSSSSCCFISLLLQRHHQSTFISDSDSDSECE